MAQIQANDLHLQKLHDINKVAEKDRKTFNQKYTDFGENIHPTTGHLDSAYYNNHKRLASNSNESQPKTGEFFGTEKTWQQKSNIMGTSPYHNKISTQEEDTHYNKKSTEEEMFIGKYFFCLPINKKNLDELKENIMVLEVELDNRGYDLDQAKRVIRDLEKKCETIKSQYMNDDEFREEILDLKQQVCNFETENERLRKECTLQEREKQTFVQKVDVMEQTIAA
jgi:hypothetical protein